MNAEPRPLHEGFEETYGNILVGTDSLVGGNIASPKGVEFHRGFISKGCSAASGGLS